MTPPGFNAAFDSDGHDPLARARKFVNNELTDAERLTVELLVREGLSNAEIADRRCVSARTVENQIRAATDKAKAHWGLETVSRTRLVILLYYAVSGNGTA